LTIKRIYQHPDKDVNLSTLEKIAKALGVRVVDLIEEAEE
jgi:DNA-binding Xre family transcriptional regulator